MKKDPDNIPTLSDKPILAVIFTRVSKRTQEYDRQIADLNRYAGRMNWQVQQVIAEKITGVRSNDEREGIEQLLQLCAGGQIKKVLITEVSRLGRRPSQTHQILETLTTQGVSIYIGQYNIETLLPNNKLNPAASMIFSITADMARQERETMIERIISGMAQAKRRGQTFGRKPGRLYSDDDLRKRYSKPLKALQQGLSIRKVAKLYDLSVDTVQRIKKLMPSAEVSATDVIKQPVLPFSESYQSLNVSFWLRVENNNSFVRGKKKSRQDIEDYVLYRYDMRKPDPEGWNYELTIVYKTNEELEATIDDLLRSAMSFADQRHCFIEYDLRALDGSERSW